MYNISVLILSYDKNHDLYDCINKSTSYFLDLGIECILVTEDDITGYDKRINAIPTHNKNFDYRFIYGLKQCQNPYVLVLLDDYFVHDNNLEKKLINWLNVIKNENLSALRVAKLPKKYVKKKKIKKNYYLLTNIQHYEIDFHPTIWNKDDLLSLVEGRTFSPWTLEPLFSLFLADKKSAFTKEIIEYDELVIQGSLFKKPYNKYCKDLYNGDKKIISRRKYFVYSFKTFIFNISPYWLIDFLRKVFRIKSISKEAKL